MVMMTVSRTGTTASFRTARRSQQVPRRKLQIEDWILSFLKIAELRDFHRIELQWELEIIPPEILWCSFTEKRRQNTAYSTPHSFIEQLTAMAAIDMGFAIY